MPTIAQLWRAVFPQAVELSEPPEREVTWVRVLKPRVPAFDALESGDLAILPATALRELASEAVEPAGVVDAVARAAGAGVLVVGAGPDDRHAAEALDRAVGLGLGAFSIRSGDVQRLERSAIGFLVNDRAELERQAAILEAQLERLALQGRELDAHAAAIGAFLGRAVAIERPRGRPLAVHAPAGIDSAAAAAAAYLARPQRASLRVRLPEADGEPGALVLLGPVPPSELERVVTERVATLLALELRRWTSGSDVLEPARAAGRALPADGPPWVSVVARQVRLDRPSSVAEREALRAEIRRLETARRLSLRGDAGSLELRIVLAADATDPLGLSAAGRIAQLVARPVAVSRPFTEVEQRALAEAEARTTLEAIEALGDPGALLPAGADGGPIVARADRLSAYRLLGALHEIPEGGRHARTLLGPLLVGRPGRVGERLRTLRVTLDASGLAEAAALLGVHRNTLTYRLARIEELSGWNLEDPALRFALGIALRIVQTAQADASLEPSLTDQVDPAAR